MVRLGGGLKSKSRYGGFNPLQRRAKRSLVATRRRYVLVSAVPRRCSSGQCRRFVDLDRVYLDLIEGRAGRAGR